MQPWELNILYSEKYRLNQWAKLNPSDFVCALLYVHPGDAYVCITPYVYFQHNHCMYNDSMPITHMLPEYLVEIEKSVFEVKRKVVVSTVYHDLLSTGFMHKKSFQDFIENTDAALIYG